VAVEKGRLEKELDMARRVQMSLLPRRMPEVPGWEFVARWKPARQVGGDYYDMIRTESGQIGLVIADVTDKGMPAALFMAFTRSIIRSNLDNTPFPASGITRANRLICQESDNGLFVTMFYGLLNPNTGELTYVNAGHNPPILVSTSGSTPTYSTTWLTNTGMALGIQEDAIYKQGSVMLNHGDFIAMYTDGVTEAMDAGDEQFGMERLQRVLLENQDKPATEIASTLERSLDQFTGGLPPNDDITIVITKRK
jgi:sigma-B regulation protein RsbU (phosphoserine phosphatase)